MTCAVPDLSVLREGQLRRLVLAQLASSAGDFMVLAALPFAVFSIGGSGGQVGVALACQAAVFASLLIVAGIAGDRLPRRLIMVCADLVRCAAQGAVAILLLCGEAEYWQLLVAQAVLGGGTAFFMPAMNALLPQVVRAERLQEANAIRGILTSGSAILGPAIAAVALATSGAGWAYAVDALSFMVSAALLTRLRPVPAVATEKKRSPLSDLVEGWTAFRRRTWVWVVVAEFALLNMFVFAPFFVIGPTVAAESLGGPGAWGGILAAMGAGELAGGLIAMSWKPVRPLVAATLIVALWVAPLLLLATLAPVALVAAGAAAAGASVAIFGALWETTLQTRIPTELRSRLSAYDLLGSLGLVPLGYLLGGLVQSNIGAQPGLVAGTGIVAIAILSVLAVPSVRRLGPVDTKSPLAHVVGTNIRRMRPRGPSGSEPESVVSPT